MMLCYAYINKRTVKIDDAESFMPFSVWENNLDNMPLLPKDRLSLKIINREIRTILHVPIVDKDEAIGVLELFSFDENVVSLDEEEIRMIENIVSFVPSIIRNSELYNRIEKINKLLVNRDKQIQEEIKLASKIQKSLLGIPPDLKGTKISCFYKPMERVGGDFFDFIMVKDPDVIGIFISDVSGHGVPAAFITTMLKVFIETSGENKISPPLLLKYLNKNLIPLMGGNFITAFYGVYDSENKILRYSNSSHNFPLLIRDKHLIELKGKGKFIGVFDDVEFEEKSIKLKNGDKLIFYTDGVIESVDSSGINFEEKFRNILLKNSELFPDQFIQNIYYELLFHRGDYNFEDDICLICMNIG
ncbi:MAG TPA: SpoIIE family protein phosphatase [Spirochaetota bacterium]|nr:SpoIIE family protein phosphatase [Spirochaetota bacterium]HPQ48862.1 SpoIIE family protein phosphatase [Spirochaetota bacterium]